MSQSNSFMQCRWKHVLSSSPAQADTSPMLPFSKWQIITSPRMCFGQCCLFFISAEANTSFFTSSTVPWRTQKPHSPQWFCQAQHEPQCFTKTVEFFPWSFSRFVFPFHDFHCMQIATDATGHCMTFIPKRPWLGRAHDKSRTCALVVPFQHGLIQIWNPCCRKCVHHICIPRFKHSLHFPQGINVRRWCTCTKTQTGNNSLKLFGGHAITKSKWCTGKWQRWCLAPKIATRAKVGSSHEKPKPNEPK